MAQKKQNNKKQNNGYFQQNIQKYGENFLERLTARDIQNDYKRILRDIAYNPGKMYQYAQYFCDMTFIHNLYTVCEQEMMKRWCTQVGLAQYQQMVYNQQVQIDARCNIDYYVTESRKEYETYYLVIEAFNGIVRWLNSGYDGNTILSRITGILEGLASALVKHKYYL